MKFITEPTVKVVAATQFIGDPDAPIPPDGDSATQLGAFAAKGCYESYGTDGRPNRDNQARIIASGHGSVLEHYYVSLRVTGVSRGMTLELNRHRHLSISQRSTRYTAEDDASFVLEPYLAQTYKMREAGHTLTEYETRLLDRFIGQCKAAQEAYVQQVQEWMEVGETSMGLRGTKLRKWARGKARDLLPHALETRGIWTANLRAWRHIIESRSAVDAEAEIRRFAGAVYDALIGVAPQYFEDYEVAIYSGDHLRTFLTKYPKV